MNKICTGGIRKELAKDLIRSLERVINAHLKKDEYFILVYTKWFQGNIVTKLIILPRQIRPLLGTMLIYINNKLGRAKLVWSLPLDIPLPEEVFSDEGVKKVFDSAREQRMAIHFN